MELPADIHSPIGWRNPALPFVLRFYFRRRAILSFGLALVLFTCCHIAVFWLAIGTRRGWYAIPRPSNPVVGTLYDWLFTITDWRWSAGILLALVARRMLADRPWREQLDVTPITKRQLAWAVFTIIAIAATLLHLGHRLAMVGWMAYVWPQSQAWRDLLASEATSRWISGGGTDLTLGTVASLEFGLQFRNFFTSIALVGIAHGLLASPQSGAVAAVALVLGFLAINIAQRLTGRPTVVGLPPGASWAAPAETMYMATLAVALILACWYFLRAVENRERQQRLG